MKRIKLVRVAAQVGTAIYKPSDAFPCMDTETYDAMGLCDWN